MTVALLDSEGETARALAAGLARAGEPAELLPIRPLPDAPLRLRKIGERPGRIPGALVALLRGGHELAHAFAAEDAAGALAWSRLTRRPVVFTVTAALERATLADRRLRLELTRLALERSGAVLAPDEAVAESVWRWMALRPGVVPAGDTEAHVAIYRGLVRR